MTPPASPIEDDPSASVVTILQRTDTLPALSDEALSDMVDRIVEDPPEQTPFTPSQKSSFTDNEFTVKVCVLFRLIWADAI